MDDDTPHEAAFFTSRLIAIRETDGLAAGTGCLAAGNAVTGLSAEDGADWSPGSRRLLSR